jgi:hypothetical protein
MKFLGLDKTQTNTSTFFSNLPIINRKESYKAKPILYDRYIECEYRSKNEKVLLLIDTVNLKVDGIDFLNHFKFYPNFGKDGYILKNQDELSPLNMPIEKIGKNEYPTNSKNEILLAPGEDNLIECSIFTNELKIQFENDSYSFFPSQISQMQAYEVVDFQHENYLLRVECYSGFIILLKKSNLNPLIKMMWPCVLPPYIEGSIIPRLKNLTIVNDDGHISISEVNDKFILTRKCHIEDDKIAINTFLKCNIDHSDIQPVSQIWIESGVKRCILQSYEDQLVLESYMLSPERSHFEDYPFWNPETEQTLNFPAKNISLNYGLQTLDIIIDEKCKPIIHVPLLTFFLDFDSEKIEEEQMIEELEIYYNMEDL